MRSMNAAGSIGANSPLRFRLLVMTPATSEPTWVSPGVPATKFGIAIGNGATLPSVICSLVCAFANRGDNSKAAAPAPPIKSLRRSMGCGESENFVTDIAGSPVSAAKHCFWVKIDVHVFPLLVGLIAQHVVGLPLQHRTEGRVGRGAVARR